jgi:segregation and condensation protein B
MSSSSSSSSSSSTRTATRRRRKGDGEAPDAPDADRDDQDPSGADRRAAGADAGGAGAAADDDGPAEHAGAEEGDGPEAAEAPAPGDAPEQLPLDEVPEEPAGGPGLGKARVLAPAEARLQSALESLVFASDKPITPAQLAKLLGVKAGEVKRLLDHAAAHYAERGIELVAVAGGYQFRTVAENAEFVRQLVAHKPVRLTPAQLETLSIVAYRQPVTRPEIDEVRGVDSGSALKVLVERGLLKLLGRKDEPGRPLLYGTTPAFLELFGLASLKDLPTLKEFSELSEESRGLFERRMGEPVPDVEDADEAGDARAQDGDGDAPDPGGALGPEEASDDGAEDAPEEVDVDADEGERGVTG